MTKIVNLKGDELFQRFNFEERSIADQLAFLEQAIELRVNYLVAHIDPKFPVSVNVIHRRLKPAYQAQEDLDLAKAIYPLNSPAFAKKLAKIQADFWGKLS